jgi:hypothetical protein
MPISSDADLWGFERWQKPVGRRLSRLCDRCVSVACQARSDEKGSVSLGNAQRFSLCSVGGSTDAEKASVNARGVQSVLAKSARSIRIGERHHHNVSGFTVRTSAPTDSTTPIASIFIVLDLM